MNESDTSTRLNRRAAIKWMLAAAASMPHLEAIAGSQHNTSSGVGYGLDPDLLNGEIPWKRIMTSAQLRTTGHLADIILPHVSDTSPSATEVGVPDFIDEWISAPYPIQEKDRPIVLEGLAWLNQESQRRFSKDFRELETSQETAICDDICYPPDALPEFAFGARFFSTFRRLATSGYYTSNVGMGDAGYVGNVALKTYEGPSADVMKQLGVERAPW